MSTSRFIVFVVLTGALASCSYRGLSPHAQNQAVNSFEDPHRSDYHLIIVDRNGQPLKPQCRRKVGAGGTKYLVQAQPFPGATIEEQNREYEEYLQAMMKNIKASGKKKLMIYIHGGMNFLTGSVQTAADTLVKFDDREKGYELDKDTYPLFVCWDSPFTGYGEQVTWIRAGKTEKHSRGFGGFGNIYSILTMPLQVVADVGRAVSKFPVELAEFA